MVLIACSRRIWFGSTPRAVMSQLPPSCTHSTPKRLSALHKRASSMLAAVVPLQFAHGPEELRPVPRHPKYKTELCRSFALTGTCSYGARCRFIHGVPGAAFRIRACMISS